MLQFRKFSSMDVAGDGRLLLSGAMWVFTRSECCHRFPPSLCHLHSVEWQPNRIGSPCMKTRWLAGLAGAAAGDELSLAAGGAAGLVLLDGDVVWRVRGGDRSAVFIFDVPRSECPQQCLPMSRVRQSFICYPPPSAAAAAAERRRPLLPL